MMNSIKLQPEVKAESKARFDIDGFVNFGRVLSDEELAIFSQRIDDISDGNVEVPQECIRTHNGAQWNATDNVARRDTVWQLLNLHQHDEVVREICEKPLIREMIELLIERPARLWSDQVIMKPAHHGAVVPWHQDTSYWGQEKRMTCWLAIDDATPDNGCMRMIPGSHLRGQIAFEMKQAESIDVTLRETTGINSDTQVYVPVPAGCASFHHPLTLHASQENKTPHRRRAIAITYQAE